MFQGFSPDTFDFLWGIRFNNNRDWFAEHKPDYLRHLYEPMKELVKEMEPVVAEEEGMKLQLSRIYRDMRMHPETFYKDSLWFTLRHRDDYWLENPCLCFELRPEGYRYGFLFVRPSPSRMEAFRKTIAEKPDAFLRLVEQAEQESGMKLEGDCYKRMKPCEDPRLERFFKMKNLMSLKDLPPDDLLFSRDLVQELHKVFKAWLPLYRFCRSF